MCGSNEKRRNAKFDFFSASTDSPKYSCQHCSYATSSISNFKRHMLVHTGERPFRCTVCNKAFTQSHVLKTHLLIHAGIKPYACQICNKNFRTSGTLNKHVQHFGHF